MPNQYCACIAMLTNFCTTCTRAISSCYESDMSINGPWKLHHQSTSTFPLANNISISQKGIWQKNSGEEKLPTLLVHEMALVTLHGSSRYVVLCSICAKGSLEKRFIGHQMLTWPLSLLDSPIGRMLPWNLQIMHQASVTRRLSLKLSHYPQHVKI